MFSRDNFIIIPGWAISDLKLSGNELIVFSVIYSFTQDGSPWFSESLSYLTETSNASKSTVQRSLASLVEKGFLEKEEQDINGVKFPKYRVSVALNDMEVSANV